MSKPVYQFRLKKDDSTYYYVDAGGLHTSSTPHNLDKSIIDWKTFQMQWKRHTVYQGVFRNYSPETVRFANEGAKILRYVFNTQGGREAPCFLEVMKLNKLTQLYQSRGVCAVDFSKFSSEKTTASVMLMEGGLSATLQGFDSTDFAITIGKPGVDPDTEYVWLDGVNLLGTYNYQAMSAGNNLLNVSEFSNFGAGDFTESTIGVVFVNQEGAYPVGTTQSVLPMVAVPGGVFDSANMFQTLNTPYDGKLKVEINFSSIDTFGPNDRDMKLSMWAHVYGQGGWSNLITSVKLWEDPDGFIGPGSVSSTTTASSETLYPGGWDYTFPANSRIVLSWRADVDTAEGPGEQSNMQVALSAAATAITLDYQYIQAPSVCNALRHYKLFNKLSHALTGTTIDPISDLLSTDGSAGPENYNLNSFNSFVTCGDALRQLDTSADGTPADPAIKTNITDFAKDAFVKLGAGLGIERNDDGDEVLRLEKLSHFFQKDVLIANLGSKITNFKHSPYNDYVGNNTKFGYKTQTYDDVNGRFEYNAEMNFKTPITRVHKDIDYTSPYRHDCYGIEYTRANLSNKKTTDSSSDNDVFFICSTGNDYSGAGIFPYPYLINRANGITAGLPTEVRTTVFNVPYTPGRNRGRLAPWLKSNYADLTAPELTFTTGTKNKDLVAEMVSSPGLVITEAENQDLTPDDNLLYLPIVLEFEAQVPVDLPDLMATNPYGFFRLIEQGVTLEGFVLECGITDATNDKYNFKLLLSPSTPLPAWM